MKEFFDKYFSDIASTHEISLHNRIDYIITPPN